MRPHRYPCIPYSGMTKKTKAIRTPKPRVFSIKEGLAAPRPFKIPFKVPERYRQGQINASVLIKVAANSFLKRANPKKSPAKKKKAVDRKPRIRQYLAERKIARRMA